MQGFVSDDVALRWITDLALSSKYLSAHFELPNWSDPTASEVTDAGYARCPVSWNVLSNRSVGNAVIVSFSLNSDTSVAAVGLHTDLTNPVMLGFATAPVGQPLKPRADIPILGIAGALQFAIGEIVLGFG